MQEIATCGLTRKHLLMQGQGVIRRMDSGVKGKGWETWRKLPDHDDLGLALMRNETWQFICLLIENRLNMREDR